MQSLKEKGKSTNKVTREGLRERSVECALIYYIHDGLLKEAIEMPTRKEDGVKPSVEDGNL